MRLELNRRELKARARAQMRQASPSFVKVTAVYLLLTTILMLVLDLMGVGPSSITNQPSLPFLPLFLTFLTYLYNMVITFSYQWWALKVYRQQEAGYGTLIDGFSMAGRVLLLQLMIGLRVLGWCVLLVVPATTILMFITTLPEFAMILLYTLYLFALLFVILVLSFRYILAPYLLIDHPNGGVESAIQTSVAMMKGWIWEYFKLELSFIGWNLINLVLSLGVAIALLAPVFLSGAGRVMDTNTVVSVLTTPLASILLTLVRIPVTLWFAPYYSVSVAGFYHTRTMEEAPRPKSYSYHPADGD